MKDKKRNEPAMSDRAVLAIRDKLERMSRELKVTIVGIHNGVGTLDQAARTIRVHDNRNDDFLFTLWLPRNGRPMVMRAMDNHRIKLRRRVDICEFVPTWIKQGREFFAEEKAAKAREFKAAARDLKAAGKEPPAYAKTFLHTPCRLLSEIDGIADAGHNVEMPAGSLVWVTAGGYISDEEDDDDDYYRFTVVLLTRHGMEAKENVSSDGVPNDALQVEPGIVTWTPENSFDAMGQGWDVFDCDGSADGRLQLCKLNSPEDVFDSDTEVKCREPFEGDPDAWAWVWNRALQGDAVCKKALEFFYARAPKEYARIRKHCTTKKPKGQE